MSYLAKNILRYFRSLSSLCCREFNMGAMSMCVSVHINVCERSCTHASECMLHCACGSQKTV